MTVVQPSALAERLLVCAERVGSKRALADAALMSESQLFRYINGDSEISGVKAVAIAKVANVDVGWLLTGLGTVDGPKSDDPRPAFRPELMEDILKVLSEVLVDFEWRLNPTQRAKYAAYAYMALRHAEQVNGVHCTVTPESLLEGLWYLGKHTFDDILNTHKDALQRIEYNTQPIDEYWLRSFTNSVMAGYENVYNSPVGAALFRRLSQHPAPRTIANLNRVIELSGHSGKWLDVGCGNGRDLTYMAKLGLPFQYFGCDTSEQALKHAHKSFDALPDIPIQLATADVRQLPYDNGMFQVVYSRMALYGLPHVPGLTTTGMSEGLADMWRVLKPGGLLAITLPKGTSRLWLNLMQFVMPEDIKNTIAALGGEFVHEEEFDLGVGDPALRNQFFLIFRKNQPAR